VKRVLLIKPLIYSILALLLYNILFKTELIFTSEEVSTFINYMQKRNTFLGASNFFVWLVIISSLVITTLNRLDKVKKKS
jgi:hypothetical protein